MNQRADAMFRAIFQYSSDGIFLVDREGIIRAINPAMERLTGWKAAEVVGKQECLVLFKCRLDKGEAVCPATCPAQLAIQLHRKVPYIELELTTRNGRNMTVAVSYAPIRIFEGAASQAVGIMREITDKKHKEDELKVLASTDGLTDLYNYRHFQGQTAKEIARGRRYLHPVSLIMLDIDDFKSYNDTYGHPEGDTLLRKLAIILTKSVRETDILARYGGEEFAVILPETGKRQAIRSAEKLRVAVEVAGLAPPQAHPPLRLTISLGVAAFPEDAKNPGELIRRADLALLHAKRMGKNRVSSYLPALEIPATGGPAVKTTA